MRLTHALLGVVLVVGVVDIEASQSSRGGRGRSVNTDRNAASVEAQVQIRFAAWEVEFIREHYVSQFLNSSTRIAEEVGSHG